MVKKHGKALLLLALCAAVAAASVNPATAVRAKGTGVYGASGQTSAGSTVPGAEAGGRDTQDDSNKGGSQDESDKGSSQDDPDKGGSQDAPGKGSSQDDPNKGGSRDESGKGGQQDESNKGGQQDEPGRTDPPEKPDDGDQPEKVTVTASVRLTKSGKAAYISWKRVEGAKAYKVQRSSKKDSGFRSIAALSEKDRSYQDVKVTKGSRYYYRVAAKMEDGRTCYSEAAAFSLPLTAVEGVKLIRYSTTSIKVTWNPSKDEHALLYKVYYAKSRDGKYKLAGTTRNNWYRVKKLANYQTYYFRVEACVAKKSSALDSNLSKAVSMTTKPYERLTIFAGDSITTGLTTYGTVNKINIGGKKKVVAAIGLNTITFRTKRVFNGLSATQSIIANKPYRVYIMLGNNDIHYRKKKDVVDGYREILKTIRAGSPDTDIVVLAVAPVTAATKNRRTGFQQIPAYNQDLKALAEKMGLKFYDCTAFMKDSSGWLKSSYAAGDGIHWKGTVYDQYAKLLEAYDKSLD